MTFTFIDLLVLTAIFSVLICLGFAVVYYLNRQHITQVFIKYIMNQMVDVKLVDKKIKAIEKENRLLEKKLEHLSQSHVSLTQFIEKLLFQLNIAQETQLQKKLDKFLH